MTARSDLVYASIWLKFSVLLCNPHTWKTLDNGGQQVKGPLGGRGAELCIMLDSPEQVTHPSRSLRVPRFHAGVIAFGLASLSRAHLALQNLALPVVPTDWLQQCVPLHLQSPIPGMFGTGVCCLEQLAL